jgi:hypothetical protein
MIWVEDLNQKQKKQEAMNKTCPISEDKINN